MDIVQAEPSAPRISITRFPEAAREAGFVFSSFSEFSKPSQAALAISVNYHPLKRGGFLANFQ